jgi:hypothetical protein
VAFFRETSRQPRLKTTNRASFREGCLVRGRNCVCIGGTFESSALAVKEITEMNPLHAPDHWLHNPIGRLSSELLWLLPLLFVAIVASLAVAA